MQNDHNIIYREWQVSVPKVLIILAVLVLIGKCVMAQQTRILEVNDKIVRANGNNVAIKNSKGWRITDSLGLIKRLLQENAELKEELAKYKFAPPPTFSASSHLIEGEDKIDRLIASNVFSFADTVYIHDTLRIPIYHYQSSDTIQAAFILKGDKVVTGFAIWTGFKVQTRTGLQWSAEPKVSGFLDRRKRMIDPKRIVKAF